MSKLNGPYKFFYSKEQAGMNDDIEKTYVDIDGEMKEYTECVHRVHTERDYYIPHEERFKDSILVGRVLNPTIKKGSVLDA